MDRTTRVVSVGATGRDFHDFNAAFRDDPRFEVVAFTAAQIPGIGGRRYPPALAGPRYPDGIPIFPKRTWRASPPRTAWGWSSSPAATCRTRT